MRVLTLIGVDTRTGRLKSGLPGNLPLLLLWSNKHPCELFLRDEEVVQAVDLAAASRTIGVSNREVEEIAVRDEKLREDVLAPTDETMLLDSLD